MIAGMNRARSLPLQWSCPTSGSATMSEYPGSLGSPAVHPASPTRLVPRPQRSLDDVGVDDVVEADVDG